MASEADDWMTVIKAAARIGKQRKQVYRYLAIPEQDSGIRRRTIGRTTFVHIPTLLEYEATVKLGRPRKN